MSAPSSVSDVGRDAPLQLRDYLAIARRRKWVAIVVVVLAVAGTIGWSLWQTPLYRSTAQVLVRSTPTVQGPADFAASDRLANEVRLAESTEFIVELTSRVGYVPDVSVRAESGASVLTFSAVSDDPAEAARVADLHSEVFVELRRELSIDDYLDNTKVLTERVDSLEAELTTLESDYLSQLAALPESDSAARAALTSEVASQRAAIETERARYQAAIDELSLAADLAGYGGGDVLNPAVIPGEPFSPNIVRNALTAFFVSLIAGLGLVFLLEHLDDRVKTREQFADVMSPVPVLAVVPKIDDADPDDARLESVERPRSPASEAYQSLRTSVSFVGFDRPFKTLQVTSAKMGEGKSTTAANLAVTMCRAEAKRVLVIDADLRRPRMHQIFGVSNSVGLCDVLLRGLTIDQAVVPVDGMTGLLSVLPTGKRPSGLNAELLSSSMFAAVLAEAVKRFDLVIIDTPPVLSVADPLAVAAQSDAVLFVGLAASTTGGQIRSALDALGGVGAPLIGAVLNGFDARAAGYYGYYYGYYGYYGYRGADEYVETTDSLPVKASTNGKSKRK
ncbi:MAG: polysaccharide biosynthesis tyrosine autokinase [Ilumatobacteraceae bacterium]